MAYLQFQLECVILCVLGVLPTNVSAFRHGMSSSLSVRAPAEQRVPCVVRDCGDEDGDLFFPDLEFYTEILLCGVAARSRRCKSKSFTSSRSALQNSNCPGGGKSQNVMSTMFFNYGCRVDDLCTAVASRLALTLTACGWNANETVGAPPEDVVCEYENSDWQHWHSNTCKMLEKVAGGIVQMITLAKSLRCECDTISPPGSRSSAILQRSMDNLYIVKSMDNDHADMLSRLRIPENLPSLAKIIYGDPGRQVIVMHNAFDARTFGIEARGCDRDIPFRNSAGWDTKPMGCKSAERPLLLAHFVKNRIRLNAWTNWDYVTLMISNALTFLDKQGLVDYSLLLSEFTLAEAESPGGCAEARNSLHAPIENCLLSPSCPGPAGGCVVMCSSIIDYLMRYGLRRQLESWWKKGKWTNYHTNHAKLWHCLGDLSAPGCEKYLQEGCAQLQNDTRATPADHLNIEEVHWCQDVETRALPASVWTSQACTPDGKWRFRSNSCTSYEGSPFTRDDWHIIGSGGRTPMQACCLELHFASIAYYPVSNSSEPVLEGGSIFVPGVGIASTELPDRVWLSNGCKPDNSGWETQKDKVHCKEYEGEPYTEKDWNDTSADGITPMEACCLTETRNGIFYAGERQTRPEAGTLVGPYSHGIEAP